MVHKSDLIIIGVSVGVGVALLIASLIFFGIRWYKKRYNLQRWANEHSLGTPTLPIHNNRSESSIDLSSTFSSNKPDPSQNSTRSWWHRGNKDRIASASGIPRYSYKYVFPSSNSRLSSFNGTVAMAILHPNPVPFRLCLDKSRDIQKATCNFTTVIGEGSFGPVYKATFLVGDIMAVKVLASNSKQGEREFQTEVSLLGRLHHRNLVNLVGYCVDKGQHMLIYEYMTNGSLANLLYNEEERTLSWEERLQIALDISHGIEYLHDGAVPPVVHRDLKSANILLDVSMRAKVADFGLSKEEVFDGHNSGLKGTYGYIDPAYISTNKFTAKSDIYSFGVILFELITAIHPHQNLVEYVNLAAMSPEGVDEILDKRITGTCNPEEVRSLASIANKCLRRMPRKRPSIVEVSQAILKIKQMGLRKEDTMSFAACEDLSRMVSRIEQQQLELQIIGAADDK